MQTNFLQSMLAFNARSIEGQHKMINFWVDQARSARVLGKTAFMVEAFGYAKKDRKQLAKLVANQRAMLVELKYHYREARISRKVAKLEQAGCPVPLRKRDTTSYEYEALLDKTLSAWQENNSAKTA